MSNKTRKRFMPVALVMAVAAMGVVALAIALAGVPRDVQAHGDSAGDCSTDAGRAIHDILSPNDPCPVELANLETPNVTVAADRDRQLTVSWGMVQGAGGYRVAWSQAGGAKMTHELGASATSYTITGLVPATTYNIEVVALGVSGTSNDSAAAMASGTTRPVAYDLLLSHGEGDDITCADRSASRSQCSNSTSTFTDGDFTEVQATLGNGLDLIDQATVRVADKRVKLHAEVNTDSPAETTTVTIRIQNADGTADLDVDPGITYRTAGLNAPGVRSIEDGTLDIQIRDAASRVFDVYVTCQGTSKERKGRLDLEVRNQDQTLVAQATIVCELPIAPPTAQERVSACYTISAMPDQGDDPDTDTVEGEDIELFPTDKSVQFTVSAFEKTYKTTTVGSVTTIEDPEDCPDWEPSSVFIRLVDQPAAEPMVDDDDGFVDENGLINDHGQVVGVSSGGELMLDIKDTAPAPAESGDPDINVVRGTFRVFTPADVAVGDKYYVELYDSLQSERIRHQNALTGAEQDYERVVYVSSDNPMPLGKPSMVTATASGSDVTVEWRDGANAVNHMVILFAYPSFELGEDHIATNQTDGTTTFSNVPAGDYVAVVVAIKSRSEYEYSHMSVSVGQ